MFRLNTVRFKPVNLWCFLRLLEHGEIVKASFTKIPNSLIILSNDRLPLSLRAILQVFLQ